MVENESRGISVHLGTGKQARECEHVFHSGSQGLQLPSASPWKL